MGGGYKKIDLPKKMMLGNDLFRQIVMMFIEVSIYAYFIGMLKMRITFGGLRYLTIFVETKKQIIMNENLIVGSDNQLSELDQFLYDLRDEVLKYSENVNKIVEIAFKLKPITENEVKQETVPSGEGMVYQLRLEVLTLQQLNKKLRLLNAHMEKIVG